MIDVNSERLKTLAEAARLRPVGRGGRPTHVATIYRWINQGVRGTRLESVRIGGSLYTSSEALQRFAERLTIWAGDVAKPLTTASTAACRRSADRVERTLDRIGI